MKRLLLVAVAALAVLAIASQGTASAADPKQAPALRPGWAQKGEVTFTVTSAPGQGDVSKTFEGPFGPMTVSVGGSAPAAPAPVSGAADIASAMAAAQYGRTCSSTYWFGVSARYTIYQAFRYNYNAVTWMGTTTESDFAIPAWLWAGQTQWYDWAPGWQYAWGNGRANLRWGVGWLSTSTGNVSNNVLVDAWGNCTAQQTFRWG